MDVGVHQHQAERGAIRESHEVRVAQGFVDDFGDLEHGHFVGRRPGSAAFPAGLQDDEGDVRPRTASPSKFGLQFECKCLPRKKPRAVVLKPVAHLSRPVVLETLQQRQTAVAREIARRSTLARRSWLALAEHAERPRAFFSAGSAVSALYVTRKKSRHLYGGAGPFSDGVSRGRYSVSSNRFTIIIRDEDPLACEAQASDNGLAKEPSRNVDVLHSSRTS